MKNKPSRKKYVRKNKITRKKYAGYAKNPLPENISSINCEGIPKTVTNNSYWKNPDRHLDPTNSQIKKCEVRYKNGDIYQGQFDELKNIKHGTGTMKYHNTGDTYEGNWMNDLKHGTGTMEYHNTGDTYNGEWKEDKKNGTGTMDYNTGDTYEGNWMNDLKHGKGKMDYNNVSKINDYEGEWKFGIKYGYGEATYKTTENRPMVIKKGYWIGDKYMGEKSKSMKSRKSTRQTQI